MGKQENTQVAAAPKAGKVKMIRPDDRSPEPVVAEIDPDKVSEWAAEGWAVKASE